ncbi:MAG: hypothetical protein WDM77_17660 [Steroidobacteraceae bacterium]
MISRTAFNQLRHSWPLLLGTLLGLLITYLLPPLLLGSGSLLGMIGGATAWALMSLCYAPMVRFYDLNPLWVFTLPAAAAFYGAATLHSAWQYRRRAGRPVEGPGAGLAWLVVMPVFAVDVAMLKLLSGRLSHRDDVDGKAQVPFPPKDGWSRW